MVKTGFYTIRCITVITAVLCCWHLLRADGLNALNDIGNPYGKGDVQAAKFSEAIAETEIDFPVYLYFADATAPYLRGEERSALRSEDPVTFCRQIIEGLISGPARGLARTIPPETRLHAVFIEDKTAYVDLSGEIITSHPGGISSELMTIYSIVNSLVLNVETVDNVKILITGQDADTLSGHIDIRFPLNADIVLIR